MFQEDLISCISLSHSWLGGRVHWSGVRPPPGHSQGDPAGLRQARLHPGGRQGHRRHGGGPGLLQGDALPSDHGWGHQLSVLWGVRSVHGQNESM